jgi:hypothetical protein
VVFLVLIGALCGCEFEAPEINSASYVEFSSGLPGPRVELSDQQVQALSVWLFEHRSGWSRNLVTYSPRILIAINQKDGESSSIDLWSNTINYYGSAGQFQRKLSESEALVVFGIIGAQRK